jgi:hypothetical protein
VIGEIVCCAWGIFVVVVGFFWVSEGSLHG